MNDVDDDDDDHVPLGLPLEIPGLCMTAPGASWKQAAAVVAALGPGNPGHRTRSLPYPHLSRLFVELTN